MEGIREIPSGVREGSLAEKLGKNKARAIASVALAAASLLGISGKPNSGVGVGVEVPHPVTGEQVSVGVLAYSVEDQWPKGLPQLPGRDYTSVDAYEVRIGGAGLAVYTAFLKDKDGSVFRTVGVYPGFETKLGSK